MVGLLGIAVTVALAAAFALLFVAVHRRNVAAIVNAAAGCALAAYATGLAAAPTLVLGRSLDVGLVLPLWLAVAAVLHSIGMLGWYDTVSWWDHLTHAVSTAFLAALVYAAVLTVDLQLPVLDALPGTAGVLTVALTFAVGIAWELIELVARELARRFDVEPVLIYYGWQDTALDLVFNVVGALLVVALDLRLFVPVAERHPDLAETLLLATMVIVAAGSLIMASLVRLSIATRTDQQ